MNRTCEDCLQQYDDARCSTICPHQALMPDEDLNRKEKAFNLLGKRLRFAHIAEGAEEVRVQSIGWNGMVTLAGWSGEFSPDIFVVVE
jgi:hypothetical protein